MLTFWTIVRIIDNKHNGEYENQNTEGYAIYDLFGNAQDRFTIVDL